MTYETYQIPENHIRTLQKFKAAKLTLQYLKEHDEEPPANIRTGFMDISEEEYEKYRKTFFAVDFSNGITGEGAIINTPDERPNTRYNEYYQCVYNIVDTKKPTPLFFITNTAKTISDFVGYIEIDGKEVDVEDLYVRAGGVVYARQAEYLFDSIGTHRVDFLKKEASVISPITFSGNTQLREVTFPEIVRQSGSNKVFMSCSGLYVIRFNSETPPTFQGGNTNNDDFKGAREGGTIVVPKGTKPQYVSWLTQIQTRGSQGLQGWVVEEMDE